MNATSSLVLAFTFAVGLGLGARVARAGQEGHGGDPLAAEFVTVGHQVLAHLQRSNDLAPDLDAAGLQKLQRALVTTRVDVVDMPLYDYLGDQVDARAIPDPLRGHARARMVVQVNRRALYDWLEHGHGLNRLVLHEYLWVIGLDDQNYRLSARLTMTEPATLTPAVEERLCHYR
jgi:hypothetical protein